MRAVFYMILSICSLFALCYASSKEQMAIECVLHHAKTEEDLRWGLMGKKALARNEGMLFHYSKAKKITLWAFNCFIDLDIAFLDSQGQMIEIGYLKAYPKKMEEYAPILSLEDIASYTDDHPLVSFFRAHALNSEQVVSYALEMPGGFFKEHGIQVGDQCIWKEEHGWIILSKTP